MEFIMPARTLDYLLMGITAGIIAGLILALIFGITQAALVNSLANIAKGGHLKV